MTMTPDDEFDEDESILPALENAFRDELNLAEFPIAALTDRMPGGQTTLVFTDTIEQRDGSPIIRRLTIEAPPKHGLPTALDDEVMVGLIQLTKRRNNFTDQKVMFSRYELIDLLGWPQDGRSYQRIEESLHRWVGVVLTYENAWWDNRAKSWVDEHFHILDNVGLYDSERRKLASKSPPRRGPKKAGFQGDPLPLSSFRWNEVIFRSFQSGNLKQLDLDFYLRLKLPTTKRMFRFLDKRFYRRDRLEFDLQTLACEHIGMSRAYAATDLKRKLRPALEELEALGFLAPLPAEERYVRQARGLWRVILVRGPMGRVDGGPMPGGDEDGGGDGEVAEVSATEAEDEADALLEALKERGVSAKVAAGLVAGVSPGQIRAKLEVFDWMIRGGDRRVGKNPAGYLVSSIRSDYQAPEEFRAEGEKARARAAEQAAEADGRRRKAEARDEQARARAEEARQRGRWEALAEADREAITASVRAENPGLGRWKKMLEPLCLAEMSRRLAAGWVPPPAPPRPTQAGLFPDGGGQSD